MSMGYLESLDHVLSVTPIFQYTKIQGFHTLTWASLNIFYFLNILFCQWIIEMHQPRTDLTRELQIVINDLLIISKFLFTIICKLFYSVYNPWNLCVNFSIILLDAYFINIRWDTKACFFCHGWQYNIIAKVSSHNMCKVMTEMSSLHPLALKVPYSIHN